MRILTVCTSTQVFGAEAITLKLLEGLKIAGHEQIAVTTIWTDGEFSRQLARLDIREIKMPFGFLSKRIAWQPIWWTTKALVHMPLLWFRWFRLLREFRPETLLFTNPKQALSVFPWIARQPSYLIEHTYQKQTRFGRIFYKLLSRRLTGFVTVSKFMGAHLPENGVPPSQIHVIRNGPLGPLNRTSLLKEIERLPAKGVAMIPRIGIIGQVSRNKGYDCLVEAALIMQNAGVAFHIVVFGSGAADYVETLKNRIEALHLRECFEWRGYEPDKEKIYAGMDVCVVPSCFNDPLPTVAIEASAHAIPLVVSNAGGLPEIVEEGVTGWLVEPGEPKHLAERLQWLLLHPKEAAAMGAAGQKKVFAEFTQERMVVEFERLFTRPIVPTLP